MSMTFESLEIRKLRHVHLFIWFSCPIQKQRILIWVLDHFDYSGMALGFGCLTSTVTYNNASWISHIDKSSVRMDSSKKRVDGKCGN